MRRLRRPDFLFLLLALTLVSSFLFSDVRPASAVCTQPGLFQQAVMFPTGSRPRGLAVADVNRDGIPDVIETNENVTSGAYATTIGVMLGNGSGGVWGGGFAPPVLFPVGTMPLTVVARDFDGDGILDLAVANWSSNNISILHGTGTGAFTGPVNFGTGANPFSLVAADFNHDEILDLAVCNNGAASVSVLLGNGSGGIGNGTFATAVLYLIADLSTGLAVADLNHDGALDLVATANYHGQVAVLLGNGDGTFAPAHHFAAGLEPFDIAIWDINGDGFPDLAVANGNSGGLAILLGAGDGSFAPPVIYGSGINGASITAGDFNQDGILDVAIPDATRHTLATLLGQGTGGIGDGSFVQATSYALGTGPRQVVSVDLDQDGRLDLLVADKFSGDLAMLLGTCAGAGSAPESPQLVSVLDVPNDQGGKVFLRWGRSSLDRPGSASITGYRVWRRLPPLAAAAARQALLAGAPSTTLKARPGVTAAGSAAVDYWEAIATLPAEQLAGYGYTAPTTQDSMAGSNPYTAFFVTALTASATTFYESNVDSGYSVDNLAPPMPTPFVAAYGVTSNALHWGTSPAPDLAEFRLYRGLTADFTPGPGNAVVATRDTGYVDAPGAAYYKLFAVDVHGNLSRYALVSPQNPIATLASLVSVDARAGQVRLTWYSAGNPGLAATVYRRTVDASWTALGGISADGSGYLRFEDDAVITGTRYGYRLGFADGGGEVFAGETWVTPVPWQLVLAGVWPNPTPGGHLNVQFELPAAAAARLELFDVGGRRLVLRDVGVLGPGRHAVDLAEGTRIPAGRYLLRLSQGGLVRTASAVVLD
jgi:hypothetical protein